MVKAGAILKKIKDPETDKKELECGIIMPIAKMDGYSESHWQDVKSIIIEAVNQITEYKFNTKIVSDSKGEMNVIQKNIISNIYNADMVICDISGRNPNVLFELGMRLTFDRPTIIIMDDVTPFIFDTGIIETLIYPKDLRFNQVVEFKETLAERLKITYKKSVDDETYSTFLGHFGQFKVPKLDQTAVTEPQEIILAELVSIRDELKSLKDTTNKSSPSASMPVRNISRTHMPVYVQSIISKFEKAVLAYLIKFDDSRPAEEIGLSTGFSNFVIEQIGLGNFNHLDPATIINTIYNHQKKLDLV